MKNTTFVDHVIDLMSPLGPIRCRAMMGGHTIFWEDLSIALIVHDRLYLKVDAETKERFEAAGGEPFTYHRKDGQPCSMSYWTPPDEALDDVEALRPWAAAALGAAARSKKPKKQAAAPKRAAAKAAPVKRAAPVKKAAAKKTSRGKVAPG